MASEKQTYDDVGQFPGILRVPQSSEHHSRKSLYDQGRPKKSLNVEISKKYDRPQRSQIWFLALSKALREP